MDEVQSPMDCDARRVDVNERRQHGESSCLEVRFGFLVERVGSSFDEFACVSKDGDCFSITAGSAEATNKRLRIETLSVAAATVATTSVRVGRARKRANQQARRSRSMNKP